MNFGDRSTMLDMANTRLAELKKKGYQQAQLLDADSIRAIFLVVDNPLFYHKFAVAQNDTGISRKLALRKLFRPASGVVSGITKL
jgi:formate dehydrogenase iron-sulfur subunit